MAWRRLRPPSPTFQEMGSPLSPVGRCGGCVPPGLRRTLGHYGGWQVHPHVLPKRPSLFSWGLRLPLGARPPSLASTSGEAASPSSAGRGRVGWQPRSRLGRCGRGVPAVRLNFSRSLCLGSRPPPRPKRRGAGAVRVRILAVPMPAPAHVSCVHPCTCPRRRPRLRPGMRPYTSSLSKLLPAPWSHPGGIPTVALVVAERDAATPTMTTLRLAKPEPHH